MASIKDEVKLTTNSSAATTVDGLYRSASGIVNIAANSVSLAEFDEGGGIINLRNNLYLINRANSGIGITLEPVGTTDIGASISGSGPIRMDTKLIAISGDKTGPTLSATDGTTSVATGLYDSSGNGDEVGVAVTGRGVCVFYPKGLAVRGHDAFGSSEFHTETGVVSTTDATVTNLLTLALNDNSVYWVEVKIAARESTGTDRAMYVLRCCVYRQGGGNATLEGTVDQFVRESAGAAGWDATLDTSTTDLRVRVTGAAATTIYWVATIQWQTAQTST